MLSYFTTGESHGKGITAIIKGLPLGLTVNIKEIYSELKRRRLASGRGPRMNRESDKIEILSGIRKGKTIGTPLTILVGNYADTIDRILPLTKIRPGHIDLAAAMKFLSLDGRVGAERSSARETVGRVIAGSVAKSFLNYFNIKVIGYVSQIGSIPTNQPANKTLQYRHILKNRDNYFYTMDKKVISDWKTLLAETEKNGDTLGGVFEVVGFNIPVGLGDHTHWEDRLDARFSQAIMAIPAVKGVEIGLGFGYSDKPGSQVMDLFEIHNNRPILNKYGGWKRRTNCAGGIEGGLTNGENIVIRASVKPIPTLKKPLPTIDIKTKRPSKAQVESSDICAVSAASVVGESVVAFEIARAFMNKFGADTLLEMSYNFKNYQSKLRKLFA
ncbi:MAG: chorismate synthase [Planctomycetota bacterium]